MEQVCIPAILQIHVCFGTDTTDAVVSEEGHVIRLNHKKNLRRSKSWRITHSTTECLVGVLAVLFGYA